MSTSINLESKERAVELYEAMLKVAVDAERARCMNVVLDEYRYWRGIEDESIQAMATGAMGASANIVSRIIDPSRPKTGS